MSIIVSNPKYDMGRKACSLSEFYLKRIEYLIEHESLSKWSARSRAIDDVESMLNDELKKSDLEVIVDIRSSAFIVEPHY
jgi:hypothetical protein